LSAPFVLCRLVSLTDRLSLDACSGSKKVSSEEEDYEKAEKAILQAVTTVEDHAQRMIAAEVETLFHGLPKSQKKEVAERAKKAVSEGSRKVKQHVDDHKKETAEGTFVYPFEDHPYPYAYPQINNKNKPDQHNDHRILHAVEAAEKAVLHAIEGEVDTLFHHEEHHHEEAAAADAQKHKTTVKEGLKKASKRVEDHHEDRRSWLQKNIDRGLLDYPPSMFLE